MGSPPTEPCRDTNETRHQVTLNHDFLMEQYEVTEATFAFYTAYHGANDGFGVDWPAANLSWHDAVEYCNKRSEEQGFVPCYLNRVSDARPCTSSIDCRVGEGEACVHEVCKRYQINSDYAGAAIYACPGFRLPTEAEWEYAYRAATVSALYSGELADADDCTGGGTEADLIAVYGKTTGHRQDVGQRAANAWGLFDLAGNVAEWCHDDYAEDLGASPAVDPVTASASASSPRVGRGGSYINGVGALRAAARARFEVSTPSATLGVRCVLTTMASCGQAIGCAMVCGNGPNCVQRCRLRLCQAAKKLFDDAMGCVMSKCLSQCLAGGLGPDCVACVSQWCTQEVGACQAHTSCFR